VNFSSGRLIAPNFTAGAQLPPNPTLGFNGMDSAVGRPLGTPLGGLPPPLNNATSGALPPRPYMPDDPVIPHNGWATAEEAEKAFNHLLRKAGVDPTWTWDQTMRAVITDPLYKSFNSLAEKKACWQKVCYSFVIHLSLHYSPLIWYSTSTISEPRRSKSERLVWQS